jgi:hypothetical protein
MKYSGWRKSLVVNDSRTGNDPGPGVDSAPYVIDINYPVTVFTFLGIVYALNLVISPLCSLQTFRSHRIKVI